ncbi:hypothetical protein [Streptomyces cinereoruber]|uniref:hypothetical protein n=1 Tax=Streptomyces cinereoruber TaxID=67260 RepID=UPI00363586DF
MEQVPDPRIPGFRYRPVTRYVEETTTINGISRTEKVPYEAWEPVPPRDWDRTILRGITRGACVVTVLAAGATAASIGGLLSNLIWEPGAYAGAVVLTVPWLSCQAAEYYLRREPERAKKARVWGWIFLVLSMGAVFLYGVTKGQPIAGAIGATLDMASKGMWMLVHMLHHVPLSRGVANWLRREKEELAADAILAADARRLSEYEAYLRAVYPEHTATRAITTVPETLAIQGGMQTFGQVPVVAAPAREAAPAPVQEPVSAPVAPQVSGQDVRTVSAPVSAPVPAPAPTPAPVAPHTTGPSVRTVSVPVSAPVAAPVPPVSGQVPAMPAAPPAAPTVQLNKPGISVPLVPSPVSSPSVPSVPPAPVAEQPAPLATVSQISRPPIAKICRDEIAKKRAVTDEELFEAVVAAGYDRDQINPDSIRRTAQRIDPDRKKAS